MHDLSSNERWLIIVECKSRYDQERNMMRTNAWVEVCALFPLIPLRTLRRTFKCYMDQRAAGIAVPNLDSKRKGRCGRKSKLTDDVRMHYNEIGQEYANLRIRLNIRLFAHECSTRGIEVSRTSVWRHFKTLKAVTRNLRIKPSLSEEHRVARLHYVINQLSQPHGEALPHQFKDQYTFQEQGCFRNP